jgi:hypothetical protein
LVYALFTPSRETGFKKGCIYQKSKTIPTQSQIRKKCCSGDSIHPNWIGEKSLWDREMELIDRNPLFPIGRSTMNSHRRMAKEFNNFVLLMCGGMNRRLETKSRKLPNESRSLKKCYLRRIA